MVLATFALVMGGVALVSMPAEAMEGYRYVNAATGVDAGNDCASTEAPCATVGRALAEAQSGDIIEIADGVYTEVLTVSEDVGLRRWGGPGAADGVILQACAVSQQAVPCPDEAGRQRVITAESVSLTLQDVTVRHGNVAAAEAGFNVGGGIYALDGMVALTRVRLLDNGAVQGGGIYGESAIITVTDSLVSGNKATVAGGGIATRGVLTISDSEISGNTATGVPGHGGGVHAREATITLTGSQVSGNTSRTGGGLTVSQSEVTVTDSTLVENTATEEGGGVRIFTSTLSIVDSTIGSNHAEQRGGGLFLSGSAGGPAALSDSLVSENTTGGRGGGIGLDFIGSLTLSNVVIADNESVGSGGGISHERGGSVVVRGATVTRNTAGANGGGIHSALSGTSPALQLIGTTVSDNSAGGFGGGVYSTSHFLGADSVIAENRATRGGGIYQHVTFVSASSRFTHSAIVDNTATQYGHQLDVKGAGNHPRFEFIWWGDADGPSVETEGGDVLTDIYVDPAHSGALTLWPWLHSLGVDGDLPDDLGDPVTVTATALACGDAEGVCDATTPVPAWNLLTGDGPQNLGVRFTVGEDEPLNVTLDGGAASIEVPSEDRGETVTASLLLGGMPSTLSGDVVATWDVVGPPAYVTLSATEECDQVAASVEAGASLTVCVTLYDAYGARTDAAGTYEVEFSGLEEGQVDGVSFDDALVEIAFAAGRGTVTVVSPRAAADLTLHAEVELGETTLRTDDDDGPGQGLALTVTPSEAHHLAFRDDHDTLEDETYAAGTPLDTPTIEVRDQYGNLVTTAAGDVTATLTTLTGGPAVFTGDTTVPAEGGEAQFMLSVDAAGTYQIAFGAADLTGVATGIFTITVPSDEARLDSVTLSTGILAPEFDRDVFTGYTADVPNDVTSITLMAVPVDDHASIAISGGSPTVPLAVGENAITVTVTAEDGVTTQAYVITVTRAEAPPSDDASLSSLSVAPGTLAPAFDPDVLTGYSAAVDHEVTSVVVTATPADGDASVGVVGATGLAVGENTITVTVTAEDGVTTQAYVITVTRAEAPPSDDASLSSLSVVPGTLAPAFDPDVLTGYSAAVDHEVTSVVVTATPADGDASVSVAGETGLLVGENTITVTVTAEDGITTQAYVITVTRADAPPSDDASLSSLSVAPGTLAPAFDADVLTGYSAAVDHDVTSVVVTATPADGDASVSVAGATGLAVGENTITVTVTAEDGVTTRAYVITVTRAEAPAAPVEPEPPAPDPVTPSSGDPVEDLLERSNETTAIASAGQPTSTQSTGEDGSTIQVSAPAGVLPQGAALTAAAVANLQDLVAAAEPPPGADLVLAFVVQARSAGGEALTAFDEPVDLVVTVPASMIPVGVTASTLVLTFWNGAEWVEVQGTVTTVEGDTVTITASVDHFTVFSIVHQPSRGQFTTPLPTAGVTLTTWGGGGYGLLEAALGHGRTAWVAWGGRWSGYIPGAPASVNADFLARYPDGLLTGAGLVVVSR